MADTQLTQADLVKLITFVELAQALVQIEAPAIRAKMEALLRPPEGEPSDSH